MCSIYHTLFDYYPNLCYTTLVIFAGVAQSVAHLIGSEEVTGSIPVASFQYLRRFSDINFSEIFFYHNLYHNFHLNGGGFYFRLFFYKYTNYIVFIV